MPNICITRLRSPSTSPRTKILFRSDLPLILRPLPAKHFPVFFERWTSLTVSSCATVPTARFPFEVSPLSLFSPDEGSTVVSVFLHKTRKQLITAHVGDARAALISLHDSFNLTADHKPSNPSEKERVELLGGRIINYGVLRVQGVLAVTRALGDFSLRPFVSNVPTVSCYALQGTECFLVLASDGLWWGRASCVT